MSDSTTSADSNAGDSIEELGKKIKRYFERILTNPILMGALTIIGFGLAIYNPLADKKAKPVFKVISDVVITERGTTTPKIKIFYDTSEVENVRAVTIALWNAGDLFLDKTSFSKDKPISLLCDKPITILDFNINRTSRSDLILDPTIYLRTVGGTPKDSTKDYSQYDYLTLTIKGDEGLEAQDGIALTVLYTTNAKQPRWFVDGRIKGVPEGFQAATDVIPSYSKMSTSLGGLLTLGLVYGLIQLVTIRKLRFILLVMFSITTAFWLYLAYSDLPLVIHAASIPDSLTP